MRLRTRASRCLLAIGVFVLFPLSIPSRSSEPFLARRSTLAPSSATVLRVPSVFVANAGQYDARVRFVARGARQAIFATDDGVTLAFESQTKRVALGIELSGGAARRVEPADPDVARVHYMIGRSPRSWNRDLPTYRGVSYRGAWPGVDATVGVAVDRLKYEFLVSPGADPSRIRLRYRGADAIRVADNGDLHIQIGDFVLVDTSPRAFQRINGETVEVSSAFVVFEDGLLGFDLADYDAAQPLVIDPELVYASYLGGSGWDEGRGIAVDASGSMYITGFTQWIDFPTTPGAYQTVLGGQDTNSPKRDAFITKVRADGTALVYSTYLGGTLHDESFGIAVDQAGNAFVTGFTESPDFPTTDGAFQRIFVNREAFVAKLDASGSNLAYATFFGGIGSDIGHGIAVDATGRAFVAGGTRAGPVNNLPGTSSGFQPVYKGGFADAFLVRLNPAGSGVEYGTYLGGTGFDTAYAIALLGPDVFLTGQTSSTDFPTSPDAYSPTPRSVDPSNVFVARVNTAVTGANSFVYGTYLSGSGEDRGTSIAVDGSGRTYLTGSTSSNDFPVTLPPTAPTRSWLTKLDEGGRHLIFSTYVVSDDLGTDARAVAVDAVGNGYVAGLSDDKAFVAKFSPEGAGLDILRFGGTNEMLPMGANSVTVGPGGIVYVAGSTQRLDFPATPGAFQPTYGSGAADAFVAKVVFPSGVPTAPNIALNRPMFASSSFDSTFTPDRAVDGNASTRWSSEFSDPQWIAVDLGGVFSINRVVLNWEVAYAAEYQLLFSDDGLNWRLALAENDVAAGIDDLQVSGIARYVGIYGVRRGTPYGYSLWEFEVYGTPATNLALNRLAVASSSFDANFTPNRAVDGDPSTRWSSEFDSPEWIAIDLGGMFKIQRIVLDWEAAFASQYLVMLSDDGLNWRTVALKNDNAPGIDQFDFSGVARYVGVYGAIRATPYGYSLWELEAYGGTVP